MPDFDKCKKFKKRRAGVLCHITSLPGDYHAGDLGHSAYRFIEFLHSMGFKVWQVLPLGPTHEDRSPYQCLSTHAGDPMLISIDWLIDRQLVDIDLINEVKTTKEFRQQCLQQASKKFYDSGQDNVDKLNHFIKKHKYWIEDYACFIAFKTEFNDTPWYEWPAEIRHRDQKALESYKVKHIEIIERVYFEQYIFFKQWSEIRAYAKQHGIELFGDIPIFVARDSADVWADRANFLMDAEGDMPFVSGVPPDAFSETGQRWGNPLYDWKYLEKTDFKWWSNRIQSQLELYDVIRLDHFRGLESCWYIPADEETAIHGSWVKSPGEKLLKQLYKRFEFVPLIAEDLGVITDDVIKLKNTFSLPGMKVLQFAFDGNVKNPHLPHNHKPEDVIYTGTHDNNTTLGWLQNKPDYNQVFLKNYLEISLKHDIDSVMSLIRAVMASVSFLAVIPLQDILMLGQSARMNIPGTAEGNWNWRFDWTDLKPEINEQIKEIITIYQR